MDPVVKKKVYFCGAQRIVLLLLGFSFFRGQKSVCLEKKHFFDIKVIH